MRKIVCRIASGGLLVWLWLAAVSPCFAQAGGATGSGSFCLDFYSPTPGTGKIDALGNHGYFHSTPVGGVLQTSQLTGRVTCTALVPGSDLIFVIKPGTGGAITGPGLPDNVCEIGMDAIGVRFIDESGQSIPCDGSGNAIRIKANRLNVGGVVAFSSAQIVQLIKTKAITSLSSGIYAPTFDPRTKVQVHWSTSPDAPVDWGRLAMHPGVRVFVNKCSIVEHSKRVDFGVVPLDQVINDAASKPFFVKVGECSDEQNTANILNNISWLVFESAAFLRSDGRLDIKDCDGCASNVAISVSDGYGNQIDLNQKYRLDMGRYDLDFLPEGISFTHHFTASLVPIDGQASIGAGDIHSTLTVIVDKD